MIGTTELLIVLGIVVLVFGGQKLPQLGAGIGKAIRNFKDEAGRKDDDKLSSGSDEETHKLPPSDR